MSKIIKIIVIIDQFVILNERIIEERKMFTSNMCQLQIFLVKCMQINDISVSVAQNFLI